LSRLSEALRKRRYSVDPQSGKRIAPEAIEAAS
jgi:hypothetical protein